MWARLAALADHHIWKRFLGFGDKTYQTAPRWTIILVLVSIPVSLFATYLVARVAMNKVQKQSLSADKEKPTQEAGTIGHDD